MSATIRSLSGGGSGKTPAVTGSSTRSAGPHEKVKHWNNIHMP
jgi:hypothetical protein